MIRANRRVFGNPIDMQTENGNCSCGSDTMSTPYLGGSLLQVEDFFQYASILHPLAIGTIAIIALFTVLRLSSNRSVAPMTLFDWIINVALGSTLAGIVNGNSLTRGLIGLTVLLFFQFLTSFSSCHLSNHLQTILNSPPLVIIFRGRSLDAVMLRHRISMVDLNGALRKAQVWNVSQVEVCILEPTGVFSIFKTADMTPGVEPDVLLAVPAYKALVEEMESGSGRGFRDTSHRGKPNKDAVAQSDPLRRQRSDQSDPSNGNEEKKRKNRTSARDPESSSSNARESKDRKRTSGSNEKASSRRENDDGQGECERGTKQQNEIAQDAA